MTRITLGALLLLAALVLMTGAAPLQGQEPRPNAAAAPETLFIQVIPNPTVPDRSARCQVNIVPWPAEALAAVERAAAIWSTLLNGSQPIVIDVCWSTDFTDPHAPDYDPNNGYQLANCGSSGSPINFAGAPRRDTYYPLPLANQLSGTDQNGVGVPDMQCRFNAHLDQTGDPVCVDCWYMKRDGIVPPDQYDLVTVALHEIGHGLGFSGSTSWQSGIGSFSNPPMVYDRFVETTAGVSILSFTNPSPMLGSALTGDALVFNGDNAKAANGGNAPRLHAPATWRAGSSYDHLREEDPGTVDRVNGLMTPNTSPGVAIQHPGVVALGMLKDMGWEIYDLSRTYVDRSNTGLENGGVLHPFNTAREGTSAVPFGGRVLFFAGNYPERLTISRPMTLESISGTVRIGQ